MTDTEDEMTVTYLLDTATQAGLSASMFPIDDIGWDGANFVGPDERPLSSVFKLYPWEWMVREEFGAHLGASSTIWVEPAWKMLLSNKGLLPVLWKLFPHHPNLLEAGWAAARIRPGMGSQAGIRARKAPHHSAPGLDRILKQTAIMATKASYIRIWPRCKASMESIP